jgi:hypothetical protein
MSNDDEALRREISGLFGDLQTVFPAPYEYRIRSSGVAGFASDISQETLSNRSVAFFCRFEIISRPIHLKRQTVFTHALLEQILRIESLDNQDQRKKGKTANCTKTTLSL